MVTSAPATTTTTETDPTPLACPRCNGRLYTRYHEPECMQCGYAHYPHTPPTKIGNTNLMSSGTRSVIRYVGDAPLLTERLLYVRLTRMGTRIVYAVTCPFCEVEMEQSSLSGKRREIREERYRCPDGHRISLIPIPNRDRPLGWK